VVGVQNPLPLIKIPTDGSPRQPLRAARIARLYMPVSPTGGASVRREPDRREPKGARLSIRWLWPLLR
jgi:hypothetical protein